MHRKSHRNRFTKISASMYLIRFFLLNLLTMIQSSLSTQPAALLSADQMATPVLPAVRFECQDKVATVGENAERLRSLWRVLLRWDLQHRNTVIAQCRTTIYGIGVGICRAIIIEEELVCIVDVRTYEEGQVTIRSERTKVVAGTLPRVTQNLIHGILLLCVVELQWELAAIVLFGVEDLWS